MALRTLSLHSLKILKAIVEARGAPICAYDIVRITEIDDRTAYPSLHKMEHAGWLKSRMEFRHDSTGRRPPRRMYTFTETGMMRAREALSQVQVSSGLIGVST